jgi:nucleoside-triphosphatase THEP1
VGYDVVDLATGRTTLLATTDGLGVEQVGQFSFLAEGLALGRAALETAAETPHGLVIVDEVGPLELTGGGWSKQLDRLAGRPGCTLLAVRRDLAAEVARRWNVPAWGIYKLAKGSDTVIDAVIKLVETDRG